MKKGLVWLQSILAVTLASSAAHAASVCVGPTATGNGSGSDWNNMKAWSGTPKRGDTWYLADGTYAGKSFSVPVSSTTPITIKKATVSDHGPSTGWVNTLGDGQAAFSSGIQFESSHWVLDGQTGGGPGKWNTGFGFRITSTNNSLANIRIGYTSKADDVTIRHVDLQGKGSASTQGGGYSNDAVAIYGSSNVTLSHAWIHGAGRCPFFIDTASSVFEYVWVQSYYGSSSVHSEVASIWNFSGLPIGDITFRHNLFTHIVSTGGLMFDNSSNPSSHLYVYGNVFYKPAGDVWEEANGVIGGWTGGGGEEMHNVWVYDNTFANVDQSSLSTFPNIATGNRAMNNLFYNSEAPDFSKFSTHDYNLFINSGGKAGEVHGGSSTSGNPFTNSAGLDFTLTANTAAGSNLGAPFNVDGLGHQRSTWTRGAYEYCAAGTCGGTSSMLVLDPTDGSSATDGTGGTGGDTGAGGDDPTGNGGVDNGEQDGGYTDGGCSMSAGERPDASSLLSLFVGALGFAYARRRARRSGT
ncbi:MAG: hypothetical protein QM820_27130 [Minicystis sp.]